MHWETKNFMWLTLLWYSFYRSGLELNPQYFWGMFVDSQVVLVIKNPPANTGVKRQGFDPWVTKIPWRRTWQPTPGFLPGESSWIEEPSRLQSTELQRVRHDWSGLAHMLTCLYITLWSHFWFSPWDRMLKNGILGKDESSWWFMIFCRLLCWKYSPMSNRRAPFSFTRTNYPVIELIFWSLELVKAEIQSLACVAPWYVSQSLNICFLIQ